MIDVLKKKRLQGVEINNDGTKLFLILMIIDNQMAPLLWNIISQLHTILKHWNYILNGGILGNNQTGVIMMQYFLVQMEKDFYNKSSCQGIQKSYAILVFQNL